MNKNKEFNNQDNNYTVNSNDDYYINDYEDENSQVEEEKKFDFSNFHINKTILLIILGLLVLILIIVFMVKGCSSKTSGSLNLKSLEITGGTISPEFTPTITDYNLITTEKSVFVKCEAEETATITGCDSYMNLDEETSRSIVVSNKGKSKTYTIKLGNSDRDFIDSVNGTSENWTNQDVTLTVNVKNGFALADEAYSFDDGNTWQRENTKSFSENKDVLIKVKDKDNSVSNTVTIKITNIDKTQPKVTIKESNKKITATVDPKDAASSYVFKWYKDGKLISGADIDNYTASNNGTYKLLVTTKAGNSATSNSITIGSTSTSKPSTNQTTTYKVAFNANGGSNAPGYQIKVKNKTLKLSTTKPTRSGYSFYSWNTNSNGSGVKYLSGSAYTTNSNVTLYAQWIKNYSAPVKKTYTIGYIGNNSNCSVGNLSGSQNKIEGTAINITSKVPTCAGYKFTSWNTKANGSGTRYNANSSYTSNSSVTLYAQWIQNSKTFVVAFKKGTNVSAIGQTSASCTTNGSSCQITMPSISTPSGYYSAKWIYGSSSYTPGTKVTISSSAIFTATAYLTRSVNLNIGTSYCSFLHDSTVAYTSNVSGSNCKTPLSEKSSMTVTSANKTISGKNLTITFNLRFVTGSHPEYLYTGYTRTMCLTKGTNFNKTPCVSGTQKTLKASNESWGSSSKSITINKTYSVTINNYGDNTGSYGLKLYVPSENFNNPTTMNSPFSFQTGDVLTIK